jgi:cell wall-associated NlpC family hydrolase
MSKRRSAILALALLSSVSCSKRAQETERATVAVPVLTMYSKANTDADVVSQAIYGMPVNVLEQNAAWARIKTPDEYTGWAEAAAIRRVTAGESIYASKGRVATVESLFAHLYREPSVTKHKPLLSVPFDSKLELVGEKDDESERWFEVRLVNGSKAWVQHGDVTLDPAARTIPELTELSRRFLGLPYTWGGSSSFGYDCSGFTQMLCRRGGVEIPRDADEQAAWSGMTKVEKNDLEPGDLLYFGKSLQKITHTGFYLGDGEFIHATTYTHPVIQISKLEEPHWAERYVAARRWKQ